MSTDLDLELTRLGELTDQRIREAIAAHVSPKAERLAAMLEYHFGWRGSDLEPLAKPAPAGKKLRPALVLLVSQAVSGEISPTAHGAAAAVELVHNFSLVHDDIQDRSELRRHRPTVWSLWGMPQGINVGDALFALAQLVLVGEGSALSAQLAADLNATTVGLAEGQFLDIDMQAGQTPPTLDTYEAMISRKTGVLFACACRMGALAAGASTAQCEAYSAYGMQLGVAFQEQDDLLGVWGLSAETGKPDAADIYGRSSSSASAAYRPQWRCRDLTRRTGCVKPTCGMTASRRVSWSSGSSPTSTASTCAGISSSGSKIGIARPSTVWRKLARASRRAAI